MSETLALHVSNICQNRCRFCMETDHSGNRLIREILSPDEYAEIVRLGKKAIPNLTRVFLAGGEPTLNRDFLRCVASISDEIEEVDVVSNGGRFFERGFADEFASSGGHAVHLSVHSHDPSVHDSLCGNTQAHARVVSAGDHVLASGLQLYSNTVLNAQNFRQLPATAGWLLQRFPGIHRIVFYLVRPVGAADGNREVLAPLEEIAASVSEAIQALKSTGSGDRLIVRDIPPCLMNCSAAQVRFQEFFIYQEGTFRRLSEHRYRKKLKCLLCTFRKKCPGYLVSYPAGCFIKSPE